MKTINRIMLIVLTLIALAGTPAQAADYQYFPDVPDNATYAQAVNFLYPFGVFEGYPDGTFHPDGLLTRAEFATMATRLLRIVGGLLFGSTSYSSTSYESISFSDVQANHWAYPYIELAAAAGLVNGFGDGTFRPGDNLTYEQTLAILVRAYGSEYEEKALNAGGWPNGYITVAKELEITRDVEIVIGQPITRSDVAILMANTFTISRFDYTVSIDSTRMYFLVYYTCGRNIYSPNFLADGSILTWDIYRYDVKGKIVREETYNADGSLQEYWENEYNVLGQHIKKTAFRPDGAILYWTIFEYDANGDLARATPYNEDGTVSDSWITMSPWSLQDSP